MRITDLLREIDPFAFFRYVLWVFVTIYATVVTLQSLYGWYVFLGGQDRYISMIRRYVIVQGLRLRLRSFWGDVVVCLGLCIVLALLWQAHHILREINAVKVSNAGRIATTR